MRFPVRLGLVLGCAVAAAAAELPLLFTDPYLLSLAPTTSMDVCWLTSEPTAESFVEYGPGDETGATARAATFEIEGLRTVDEKGAYTVPLKVYQQVARLEGLEPGREYAYRVTSVSASGDRRTAGAFSFRTAPAGDAPIRFVLLSDLQLRAQIAQTVRMAGQQKPDLIVYSGDMVNTPYKAGEWFAVPGAKEDNALRWFNVLQQTAGGARLLQYAPIFPCPGNHEIDQQELLSDRAACTRDQLSMRIYMQLFRTLYPEQEYGAGGRHWYSADYGRLHIVSLSLNRWFSWPAALKPGWFLFDDIKAGSPQYEWLKADLAQGGPSRYTWVTQHWHMFNRATDVAVPYTDPAPDPDNPDAVVYDKAADYLMRDVKPLYESGGVNAVSFGHSHVYERYRVNGVTYIEAATIGNTYRGAKDPPCSVNLDVCPEADETRFRSFATITLDPAAGMTGEATQASVEKNGVGELGRVFDRFEIAPALPPGTESRRKPQGRTLTKK